MKWQRFRGSHYEVGYQLGQWWGEELRRRKRRSATSALCDEYWHLLKSGWHDDLTPLLRNAIRHYPEIVDEVEGMAKGAAAARIQTSLPAMFALCLGETGETRRGCSSLVTRAGNGYCLHHNEEERRRYPMCFADVAIAAGAGVRRFASVSYPFQLLGSVCGFNRRLAFQGNSIGHAGKDRQLRGSWSQRIPKTFFSRKMLEARSIEEIIMLYGSHHATLPNHHYVCLDHAAYAVRIRPQNVRADAVRQVSVRQIANAPDFATNHFEDGGRVDHEWTWGEGEMQGSVIRRKRMGRFLEAHRQLADVGEPLMQYLARQYQRHTLASLRFRVEAGVVTCTGVVYGDGARAATTVPALSSRGWRDRKQ